MLRVIAFVHPSGFQGGDKHLQAFGTKKLLDAINLAADCHPFRNGSNWIEKPNLYIEKF